jgi:hypothetical protein
MPVTIVGNNTPTAGGVVYGDGTNYVSTSAGTAGQVLLSNGPSAPSFGAVPTVNLATGVTGTLPVANGGTGATSLTANNVLLGNGTSAVQVVAPGTAGNVLTSNGTTWQSTAPVVPSTTKTWTSYTSSSTYTVPAGVTSIRVYAFGAGGTAGSEFDGSGTYYFGGGAGGGCAFGDLAVTAGQTVTITISGGNATVSYASVTRFTANKGNNCTNPATIGNPTGGTASIGTGVTNGNAYTGGAGSSGVFGGTGGASASPLGVGNAAGTTYSGGPGWGTGKGGDGYTGGQRGIGTSGGAGGAVDANGRPGVGRGGYLVYTDPLLQYLISPGVGGYLDTFGNAYGFTGGPGAGGAGSGNGGSGSYGLIGGNGGFGGGGGGVYNASASSNSLTSGAGGFGGAAGACYSAASGNNGTVGASGFGAGASTATNSQSPSTASFNSGTAGAAIVLIYA